jgi:anti-sigma B factor antagonist
MISDNWKEITMLKINKKEENGKVIYVLEGRLDTVTAPDLEKEFKDSLESVEDLMLDFEKLEYISSAGLRVLLSAQKTMNKQGKMELTHVGETIMEIFEVTGFSDILTIVP